MARYMQPFQPQLQQTQRKQLADCRKRKPPVEDDSRRSTTFKRIRLEKDGSMFASTSLQQGQGQGQGSRRRSRLPLGGLDPLTCYPHKNPLPILPPAQSKVVNWRLACFMAREYLSRGTLLGKPWPLPDSNMPKLPEGKESSSEKEKEKEGLYTFLSTDFLRSDDVYIPGILNPSQLAAWIGLR